MERTIINHIFNPLHVYCRLRDLGICKKHAVLLAKKYENIIYKQVMKGGLEK